ncbi:MAG: hypothetical protein AAFR41_05290 [Pseudomonadota bacterium]
MGIRHAVYREMDPAARNKPGLSTINAIIVLLVLTSFLLLALKPSRPWMARSARPLPLQTSLSWSFSGSNMPFGSGSLESAPNSGVSPGGSDTCLHPTPWPI